MSNKIKMLLIFLICIQGIHAQETEITDTQDTETQSVQGIEITNLEVEYFLNADFNRTSNFVGGFSVAGKIEFNKRFTVKEGISLGWAENYTSIKLFSNASYRILADLPVTADWPLELKFAWVYNGLPEYETHSHAIAPIISWNGKYFGMSVGYGARFTSFFGEGNLMEHMLPMGIYVNFINNEVICSGLSLANYTDFQIDSFIAFALAAKVSIKVNKHFTINNELEFRQSGVDGLTATFHGIVWKGGAKLTW
jgi:hypothetical protein